MSDFLRPHELQHTMLPCPPLSLLSLLKLMSIKSVMPSNLIILRHPLLLLPLIFPSTRVFPNELALASGGQSIGASASASVLQTNIQGWFLLGLTGLISLLSKESQVSSSTTVWNHQSSTTIRKHQFFSTQLSLWSNSHIQTWLLLIFTDVKTKILIFNVNDRCFYYDWREVQKWEN